MRNNKKVKVGIPDKSMASILSRQQNKKQTNSEIDTTKPKVRKTSEIQYLNTYE